MFLDGFFCKVFKMRDTVSYKSVYSFVSELQTF